jgi:pimeloyl-ACP methyl ester carboxylesterase
VKFHDGRDNLENPDSARSFERYASFARLVRFDRRGTGLSDPVVQPVTLDQQMDDLEAVIDAAGSKRVALIAAEEAGLCAMYAASHPDRVSALVLVNVAVSGGVIFDDERREVMLDLIENHWGEGVSSRFSRRAARATGSSPNGGRGSSARVSAPRWRASSLISMSAPT